LVLFDEIEKAAPSMTRLLLGVLDKATLRLGDNTSVNFERTLIFLTSNLGAEAMRKHAAPDFGFEAMSPGLAHNASLKKLQSIGWGAVKRKFSPEFVNRIDAVITYQSLDRGAMDLILDQQIETLEQHIADRLEDRAFDIELTPAARKTLLERGTSTEFGARELKRTILRMLTQPLAGLVEQDLVPPGSNVLVDRKTSGDGLVLIVEDD
jgi:ATP-dependent Clp protease ATP-binding subunit ClpA